MGRVWRPAYKAGGRVLFPPLSLNLKIKSPGLTVFKGGNSYNFTMHPFLRGKQNSLLPCLTETKVLLGGERGRYEDVYSCLSIRYTHQHHHSHVLHIKQVCGRELICDQPPGHKTKNSLTLTVFNCKDVFMPLFLYEVWIPFPNLIRKEQSDWLIKQTSPILRGIK